MAESRPAMRVLLLHNRYRQAGGEERAVAELAALLERRGHTVELLERSSAQAGGRRAAAGLLRGGLEPQHVGEAVRRLRADVVHAHNLQPLLGWRALAAARAAGARTVLHLHNFRLFCTIAIHYRDGHLCHRCHGGWTLPGAALRCRGGWGESAVYAAGLARSWRRLAAQADVLVAVSAATSRRLVEQGLTREPVVLHNFARGGEEALSLDAASLAPAARRSFALVSGRLVEEKGFDTAIVACRQVGVPLVVAGEGPERARLAALARGADVRFAGRLSEAELARLRAEAGVVLVPSRWEEPCPYAALDALADGVPVIGSDLGGLPELLDGQAVVGAADEEAWARELQALWDSPELRARRAQAALAAARGPLGEDRFYARLMEIYGCEP